MPFSFNFSFGKKKQPSKEAEKSITYQKILFPDDEYFEDNSHDSAVKNHNLTLLWLFNNIPEVSSIITYVATLCANVEKEHVKVLANEKEKPVNNSEPLKLLKNPNDVVQGEIFLLNSYTSFFIFGNTYLNFLIPIGFKIPSKIYNLPAYNLFPLPEKRMNNFGDPMLGTDPRFNPIVGYNWRIDGFDKIMEVDEVLHIKDSNINQDGIEWYLGQSRFYSAIESCNTLKFLYETVNTVLSKRGAMGYIKRNKRPNEIETVLTPDQEKEVRKIVQKNYGVTGNKSPIAYTSADVNYVKIDAPISEFIPIELRGDMVKVLCRCIGNVPDTIFSSDSSKTYNNLKTDITIIYTNVIKPVTKLFDNELSKKFGLTEINEKIKSCFDDINELKEDEKVQAEAQKIKDENARARYDNDEITLNEKLISMGLNPVANGDKRKSELQPVQQTNTIDNGNNGQNNNSNTAGN